MGLGYGTISFGDIRTELNAYGGYGGSGSARTMAAAAGFSTPDAASDFRGYSTPVPESIVNYTYVYTASDYGYWYCGDLNFNIGKTNLGRYVYSPSSLSIANAGLNGYFALGDQYDAIYGLSNGNTFVFIGYCGVFA